MHNKLMKLAAIINTLFFCMKPIQTSPNIITKKKMYAIVSIALDFLMVAKAKINPSANCRIAHVCIK